MSLFSLLVSAVVICIGSLLLIIGGSYLAYKIKRRSTYYEIR